MITKSIPDRIRPIISLTTDFGERDGYVGTMRGVILNICPEATITDLSHQIPPQDIRTGAYVLYQAFHYYPPHTVHCVVIDPGVGSKRRAIAVRTSHGIFVAPDNGILSLVLTSSELNILEAVTLTNTVYQLPQISATFHGRDVFAPAAAHIANGLPLRRLGPPAINLVRLDFKAISQDENYQVIHIDRFGNLILNLTAGDIDDPRQVTFSIAGQKIHSLSRTFADVEEGQLLAYIGSNRDHIEIAVRNGNAAQRLKVQVGARVEITPAKP